MSPPRRRLVASALRFSRAIAVIEPRGLALLSALLLAMGVVQGVGLMLLVPLLEIVGIGLGGSAGGLADAVRGTLGALGIPPTLPLVLAAFLTAYLGAGLLTFSVGIATSRLRERVAHALRDGAYADLARMEHDAFTRLSPGRVGEVLSADTDRASVAAYHAVYAAVSLVLALIHLGLGLWLAPLLTLAVAAMGGVVFAGAHRFIRRASDHGARLSAAHMELQHATHEWLQAMKVVKTRGDAGTIGVRDAADDLQRVRRLSAGTRARATFFVQALAALVLAAAVLLGAGPLALEGGTLILLLVLFARTVPRISSLQDHLQMIAHALPAFEAVEALRRAARDAAEPAPEPWSPALAHGIEVDRVTVERGGSVVLHEASFRAPAGRITTIEGESGAGKTTLLDVASGILAPTSGRILVDGDPMTPSRRAAWRSRIGYVPQDPVLFHGTVRANLAWASPRATAAEMREALTLADADFALAKGLDADVGPRGARLSGGERQRLALAMAILRRPLLLVLDEATSQLDAESEKRVLASLAALRDRTTVLLVSHRPAAREVADVVVRVADRKIASTSMERARVEDPLRRGPPPGAPLIPLAGASP